jgi:hypothetical protein
MGNTLYTESFTKETTKINDSANYRYQYINSKGF